MTPSSAATWQVAHGEIQGNDACVVKDLLVRGMDRSHGLRLFMLPPDVQRHELSHADDIAAIVAFGREHGITIEPGEVIDVDGRRIFRNWRMTTEGCTWTPNEPFDDAFMIEDDVTRCRVCGQTVKPRAD